MPLRAPSLNALRALRACANSSCPPRACSRLAPSRHGVPGSVHRAAWLSSAAEHERNHSSRGCSELDLAIRSKPSYSAGGAHLCSRPSRHNGRLSLNHRSFSHLTAVTSVNATPRIPPAFQELYSALKTLEQRAINYVNLTQLSLALRGLESEDPTLRVAVLSLDSLDSAKRLVRVLLADPLEEEQSWEKELNGGNDETAVLLRYGTEFGVDDTNPLLRTIQVPSTFLRNRRLELLLHQTDVVPQLDTPPSTTAKLESLLSLDISSASGRSSRMLYPVHKTVVVGSGLAGIQEVFQKLEGGSELYGDLLYGVVDVPWQDAAAEPGMLNISLVNVSEAETALLSFRQSLDNAFKYEHGWLNSNVATLLDVLGKGTLAEDGQLKLALRNYIESVVQGTEATILQEETERLSAIVSSSMTPATRDDLLRVLSAWAEFAHTELRDELDDALHSRMWKKIAWWKLVWRVDDIGLVMSEMLQRSYLVNAERYLQWIGGYFHASGLMLADHDPPPESFAASTPALTPQRRFGHSPTDEEVVDMVNQDIRDTQQLAAPKRFSSASSSLNTADDTTVPIPTISPYAPWPQQIATSRNALLALIPPLQRCAQGIVLRTLTTTGLSSAIGALAYVGVSDTSGYSAGAIAAFGTAWAFSGAQKEWNRCKDAWVEQAREEGKRVLEACERRGKSLVEEKAQEAADRMDLGGEGAEERRGARDAVAAVRDMLDAVDQHDASVSGKP